MPIIKIIIILIFSTIVFADENTYLCKIETIKVDRGSSIMFPIYYVSNKREDLTGNGLSNSYLDMALRYKEMPFNLKNIFNTSYYIKYNEKEFKISFDSSVYIRYKKNSYKLEKNDYILYLKRDKSFSYIYINTTNDFEDTKVRKEIKFKCKSYNKSISNQETLFEEVLFYNFIK